MHIRRAKHQQKLGFLSPFAPVCWVHIDPLPGFCVDPAAEDAAARKYQRVDLTGCIEDGQFEVTVERRGRYRLPFHSKRMEQHEGAALI